MENSQETFPAGEWSVRFCVQKSPAQPPRQLFGAGEHLAPSTASSTRFGARGAPCPAPGPPRPVPGADAPAGEGGQHNKVEPDAYPGRLGAGQGGDQEQRGGQRRPALAFPLALGPRGPLAAGHQRTPRVLRCKRDGELCPSLPPGCLLGAVVFLPTVILGSPQETITSLFLAVFPRLCGCAFFFRAHCMTGYFLHSVTVLRVEARKPERGGNWFGSYLGKLLQEKQPKHVGSKARGSGNVTLPVQGGGEDVKWRVFSILGGKGMQSPPRVPWSAPETAKGAKV